MGRKPVVVRESRVLRDLEELWTAHGADREAVAAKMGRTRSWLDKFMAGISNVTLRDVETLVGRYGGQLQIAVRGDHELTIRNALRAEGFSPRDEQAVLDLYRNLRAPQRARAAGS